MKSNNLMQLMVTLGYGELIEQATINELWAEALDEGYDEEVAQKFIDNSEWGCYTQEPNRNRGREKHGRL